MLTKVSSISSNLIIVDLIYLYEKSLGWLSYWVIWAKCLGLEIILTFNEFSCNSLLLGTNNQQKKIHLFSLCFEIFPNFSTVLFKCSPNFPGLLFFKIFRVSNSFFDLWWFLWSFTQVWPVICIRCLLLSYPLSLWFIGLPANL